MMQSRPAPNRNLFPYFLATIIPILVLLFVLVIPIPISISRAIWIYSFPVFFLVLILYFLSFRLPGIMGWLAAASLTTLLLGLTLSFLWTSGYSSDKIIGGLLPFRDGFDFYNGAKLVLSGHVISSIDESAAWRPLYSGFLATLLLITGQNLQWAIALQVGVAGICYTLSATHLRNLFGAAASAIYMTLLYFYIQHLIGTTYSETLGLAFGCLGFVLLLTAAKTQSARRLLLGLVILLIAVSERAGTFFIFPLLVLWSGWAFRGEAKFSLRHAGLALIALAATYLIANTVYDKLMVEPGVPPFGNFAFTFYGQVVGGAGYHKAFEELGVRNPAVILRAAERFFLAHPLSFFVGAAKAYRDFFLPEIGALSFGSTTGDLLVWVPATGLLLFALYRAARRIALPDFSLLLAGFIGILLSIPFLPPIDGGIRIYASTMPFFFALPAIAAAGLLPHRQDEKGSAVPNAAGTLGIVLAGLTVVVPVIVLFLNPKPAFAAPACTADQVPYAAVFSRGSYIDLKDGGTADCGRLPQLCVRDFKANQGSTDPSDEATYDALMSGAAQSIIRVFPANDLVNGRPHIFVGPAASLNVRNNSVLTGCASETLIKGRPSIYTIQ